MQRISLDFANPNDFGHKLLNFCKGNSLFIANYRCGKDRSIGAVTSKNTAVVDYLLLSPTLFSSIKELEIADFNPLFSDIHCGIHVTFHGRVTTDTTTPPISPSRIYWNATEQSRFVKSVVTNLEDCYLELSQLLDVNKTNDSPRYGDNINRVLNTIGDIFFSQKVHYILLVNYI